MVVVDTGRKEFSCVRCRHGLLRNEAWLSPTDPNGAAFYTCGVHRVPGSKQVAKA
ncbi:MAG TPA: hypothetical protein VHX38_04305 [Pseudonocardiaceae bacterium]|jgi:hypothetical protein|nr:hypothetical protein [Pseudonocardiaceae bacterium]